MEKLKSHPITLSILIAIVSALVFVVGLTWKSQGVIESAAAKEVSRHEEKDVQRAHPSIGRLEQSVEGIQKDINRIQQHLARIAGQLSKE